MIYYLLFINDKLKMKKLVNYDLEYLHDSRSFMSHIMKWIQKLTFILQLDLFTCNV